MISGMRKACAAAAVLAAAVALTACASSQAGSGVAGGAPAVTTTAPASATPGSSAGKPAVPNPVAPKSGAPKPVAVNHCAGNTRDQLVKVSLRDQHMWLCQKSTTVLATAITSGASSLRYDSTPTGSFHIQGRNRDTVLTLNTGKQYDVKYWIPFNAPLYGFHDSSWQDFPYGSPLYKTQGSHGCVHMPLQAIAFFYHWVHMGTRVVIAA